jgi:hypothetical protein
MIDAQDWTYHDFFAFALIYVANLNYEISEAEYAFLSQRLSGTEISHFINVVKNHPDAELYQLFGEFQQRFLTTPEEEAKVKRDIEELFAVEHEHQPFEREAMKLIGKML